MKDFNFAEDVVSTEVVVTDGIGDGGIGVLAGTDLITSSLSNAQKKYYYNLQFNSKDHFSVTYGHIDGSGSMNQSSTQEGETKAVYGQFYNLLENDRSALKSNQGFIINEVTQSDAYFLSVERLQMKDGINPGTWTISLSGSLADGTAKTLNLTDNSVANDPETPGSPFGPRYSIRLSLIHISEPTRPERIGVCRVWV